MDSIPWVRCASGNVLVIKSSFVSWSCHQFSRTDKTVLELKYFQSLLSSNNLLNLALLCHICGKTDKNHNLAKHFKVATRLFSRVSTLNLFSFFCLTLSLPDWCRKSSLGNGFISRKGALAIFFSPIQLFPASVHSCGGSL